LSNTVISTNKFHDCIGKVLKRDKEQGRPLADATDAAALGPAPWCLGRLSIFARYTLRLRIQWKRHVNLIVNKERSRQN